MAVRPGEAPKELPAEIKFKGAAERVKIKVTYNNLRGTEYGELLKSDPTLGEILLALISDWDAEYPLSLDGFVALEDERPGICEGLLEAYLKTRRLALEGN